MKDHTISGRTILLVAAFATLGAGLCLWTTAQAGDRSVSAETLSCTPNPFTDVCEDDWFYPYVTELHNLGAVSGYPDGTFRPGATVTRGQLVKIVVQALQLGAPLPPTHTFADVAPSNPFYGYVETGAALGLTTGYSCGGYGEPCDEQSRPYFRPGVAVSRGQTAKIISSGIGLAPYAPSLPVYADVPSTNAFYGYVNALSDAGVLGGYPCGGAGEPCDPQSRPYFRPLNLSTRAQACKITSLGRRFRAPTPTGTRPIPSATIAAQSATPRPDPSASRTAAVPSRTATATLTVTPPRTATPAGTPNPPYSTPTRASTTAPTPPATFTMPASTSTPALPTNTATPPAGTATSPANTATLTRTATRTPVPSVTPTWTRTAGGSGITANDPIPCPLWPADNIWNRAIDTLPTHVASDSYVQTVGSNEYLSNGFGSRMWQGASIGNPYNVVPTSQPMVQINIGLYPGVSDPGPYPYPTHAIVSGSSYLTPVPPSGDRHVSILRAGDCTLFESWHSVAQPGGSWSVDTGAIFHLLTNDLRPAGWSSADAAGFAILPGLLRYDEVMSGQISHAIRFTALGSTIRDTYVWPARHSDGSATGTNAPPMGTRFRLKANVDISGYPPRLRTVLQGLKTYGMFLADSGDAWQIDGAPDQRWDDAELQLLHGIHGSDFEAVDESGLMVNPNSGQSR